MAFRTTKPKSERDLIISGSIHEGRNQEFLDGYAGKRFVQSTEETLARPTTTKNAISSDSRKRCKNFKPAYQKFPRINAALSGGFSRVEERLELKPCFVRSRDPYPSSAIRNSRANNFDETLGTAKRTRNCCPRCRLTTQPTPRTIKPAGKRQLPRQLLSTETGAIGQDKGVRSKTSVTAPPTRCLLI